MQKSIYATYFHAVKNILNNIPVPWLDNIRVTCDENYFKKFPSAESYTPLMICVTFFADAENRILMGKNPTRLYGKFKDVNPEELRIRGRKILEQAVQDYLGEKHSTH